MVHYRVPLVSVIIPTYNRAWCLVDSVNSVLNQGYRNLEVIVVDDGSTDRSAEALAEIDDPRLSYHRRSHQGACAARNYGMSIARGDYIAFHDSDDIWLRDKIDMQVQYLLETGLDICFCRMMSSRYGSKKTWLVPKQSFSQRNVCLADLLKANFISTQTILGKRDGILSERFDNSFPRLQDWDYVIRLMQTQRIGFLDSVLVEQYIRKDSLTQNQENRALALELIMKKYRALYELYPESEATALESLGRTYLGFNASRAKDSFIQSFRIRPSLRVAILVLMSSVL